MAASQATASLPSTGPYSPDTKAAPEKSSCATAAAACCPCLCATVTQTATTRWTRQTAATSTRITTPVTSGCFILEECGGQKIGPYGYLASPNHPGPYPHQQLCIWHISVEEGHVITLSFRNFSLETQDVCEFDYVEVHDSVSTGAGRVLGRFCGTTFPPELTSSGPHMTVVFVADEGVADSGFNATYQAVSVLGRTCGPRQFACSTGECVQQQWLCDGWNDCPDGADEQGCGNSTYPPFTSSCEHIEVEMCRGLSYNFTSFPNIWLSIADQREAATLLGQYRVLMELACFEPLQRLVCGMFLPQCSPQGGVLQPCRSVCSSAEQQCSQALDLFSFSWPFNCH
uniref:Membrane frizzled-related protein n=1 Tax=Oreochromis aureus TaxID=47969 RepID=A0AAZ1XLT6_OREAU